MHFDTIVAPITGNQPAPVAIVRLSGPDSWEVASRVFERWPAKPESHKAIYGRLITGDEGLALPFAENHSYTGEETAEFSIHGSLASVRSLVEACLANGSRMAGPGEFTQRAFLNGKMDLTQAEGVRDTVEASTDAQLRQANLHRQGLLHKEVSAIREKVLKLLVGVEASVDFSEEIGEFDSEKAICDLKTAVCDIEKLLSTANTGRILRNGLRIAIVGPPNAGKSSLLNALLGSERAIVTEIPGTTRDYVEEHVEIGGVLCVLFDTAGLRESDDPIESIGIQWARAIALNADEVWYVYDASLGFTTQDGATVDSFERPTVVIANKLDLCAEIDRAHVAISTLSREGFEKLVQHVQGQIENADTTPLINQRHQVPLAAALEGLRTCEQTIAHSLPADLLSVGLRDALTQLGEITGETASEEIIDRIFHDFCIGK